MAGRADMISNRRHVRRALQAVGLVALLVALLTLAVGAVLTAGGAFAGGLGASSVQPAHAPILDDTDTPTSTPTPCDSVWSVVSSPNPGASSALNDVAVVTANDVWAVGYYYICSGCSTFTLVEHWDGTSWSVVPSPYVGSGSNKLFGVAAVSANDVWAVGEAAVEYQGRSHTLVEHWDGTSWSVVLSPFVGTGENSLYGVAAVSANDVWAVGYYCNTCGPYQTLIEHWDGTSWSVVPSPNVGILLGVAAVSANDVWAVGFYCNNSNCLSGQFNTLIEHWDGTSWSVVPSPNMGTTDNRLLGVAAVSANDVWAVGYYISNQGRYQTLVEHWNGTSWQVVSSPNVGTSDNQLYGITAVSTNDVWAVGYVDYSVNSTLTEHWDGTSWSVVPSPGGSPLRGIAAAAANDVWAVGSTAYPQTLVGHYTSLCSTPTNTPTSILTPCAGCTNTPTNTPTITRTPTSTLTPCPSCTYTPTPTNTPFSGPPISGDGNYDNVVDGIDFSILRAYFNWSCGSDPLCARADFNNNGIVSIEEFSICKHNFGYLGAPPYSPVPPSSGDAFLSLQPGTSGNCSAPPNGGTVQVGCRFVLDLMVNMGSVPDGVVQQTYMTFTHSILQGARVSQIATSCVVDSNITYDSTYFEAGIRGSVCNGPDPCNFPDTVDAGSLRFANGTLGGICPTGCSGTFRVARIGWCAVASGQAVLHWQFSPPAARNRHSAIVDVNGNMVQDQSLFTDYVINVGVSPTPTVTRTFTPTPTPDSAILVGHVTIQGRPAQPNPLHSVPITFTLKAVGGAENNYSTNTDASGFFTITSPGPGLYDWRVKNPQTLATSGSVTLPSSGTTQQEMGLLRQGDANNDNCTNITDFNIVKASFGATIGNPNYDERADFTGDQSVNISDFNLLKINFGQCGVDPIRPAP